MNDVEQAVDFAADKADPALWEAVISYVLEHPKMLVTLLDRLEKLETQAGLGGEDAARPQPPDSAHPATVLRRLPPKTPCGRVAAPVRRVFDSYELQRNLYSSCRRLAEEE